jgi:hypothetical protein
MSDDAGGQQPPAEGEQAAAAPSEHLNLKVKSQDGNEVYFKVRWRCIHARRRMIGLGCAARQSGLSPSFALFRRIVVRVFLFSGEEDDSIQQGDVRLLQEGWRRPRVRALPLRWTALATGSDARRCQHATPT